MTPAIRLLQKQKIPHTIKEYYHDNSRSDFGLEAAEALGLSTQEVFKTLLTTDGKNYFVAILPVCHKLNLKNLAAALGVKKLQMADAKDAERITGYLVGGISPIAQKKRLKTIIDCSAKDHELIYISGGRRGCDIGIIADDLAQVLSAEFAEITDY